MLGESERHVPLRQSDVRTGVVIMSVVVLTLRVKKSSGSTWS
jgi:hypothetical protein